MRIKYNRHLRHKFLVILIYYLLILRVDQCIFFSANVSWGLCLLFSCRKYAYINHDYFLINLFYLIIYSIYMNNSYNKRSAFPFILQEQLYTVLLSILYCALEGDVSKPIIILFVPLSALKYLLLELRKGKYADSPYFQTIRCFRNVKSSSVFRWKVGSWRRPAGG